MRRPALVLPRTANALISEEEKEEGKNNEKEGGGGGEGEREGGRRRGTSRVSGSCAINDFSRRANARSVVCPRRVAAAFSAPTATTTTLQASKILCLNTTLILFCQVVKG